MAEVNKYKEGNAEVVLADGSAVGSPAAGALTFKELAGVLGRKLREKKNAPQKKPVRAALRTVA